MPLRDRVNLSFMAAGALNGLPKSVNASGKKRANSPVISMARRSRKARLPLQHIDRTAYLAGPFLTGETFRFGSSPLESGRHPASAGGAF